MSFWWRLRFCNGWETFGAEPWTGGEGYCSLRAKEEETHAGSSKLEFTPSVSVCRETGDLVRSDARCHCGSWHHHTVRSLPLPYLLWVSWVGMGERGEVELAGVVRSWSKGEGCQVRVCSQPWSQQSRSMGTLLQSLAMKAPGLTPPQTASEE